MIQLKAVELFGTTPDRLKAVFTATPQSVTEMVGMSEEELAARQQDIKARERLEKFIEARLNEGVLTNLQNYKIYAARDLAMDCPPVNKFTLPLMLYAQGKIEVAAVATELSRLPDGDKYIQKDKEGKATNVNLPRFLDVNINLCRSVITRRVSAQSNKYNNLWPFYKYEPRGTSQVAKLRADALSQAVDMMVDSFGHRHHDVQVIRDMLVHAHSVDFQRSSWETVKSYRMGQDGKPEAYVCKQGLTFINPHPSRVFWDNAEPLAGINDDIGPGWIGYWDITRYGTVKDNPTYWNRDKIKYNADFWTTVSAYQAYWTQYYTDRLTPPVGGSKQDPAGANDRVSKIGFYSERREDASVLLANIFWKIRPVEWGLGGYPENVWLRLIVAGDGTVCYAEVMPSTPAAYAGLNENDNRLVNVSFLDELMPFQDQMTNLTTVMLELVNASLLTVIGINTDVLSKQQVDDIRKRLQTGYRSTAEPVVVEWSLSKMADELKLAPDKILTIAQTSGIGNALTECMRAMAMLAQQAEKLANISPNEQGQPAPREISATEVNEISATTSSVFSFISDAIDEYRAAKKRMIYEAMCNFMATLKVPVISRYTAKTIAAAGFQMDPNDSEQMSLPGGGEPVFRATLLGTMRNLEHDYIFTSRDGSERAVNTQAANTLTQLMQYLTSFPQLAQTLGTEQLYEMLNEIFRMSGSGYDLKLEMADGQANSLGPDQVAQMSQVQEMLIAHTTQLAENVKQLSMDVAGQAQVNAQQDQMMKGMQGIADALKRNVADTKQLELEIKKKAIIDYKNAPADVQRQMELDAGYVPSTMPPLPPKPAATAK